MDKKNYEDSELKVGPKISNRYGSRSLISTLGRPINEYVSVKAVCEEVIDEITSEIMDRTHICGDTVDYIYYLMRSYPYGADAPYMTILNRETYLDPVDIKPGKLYTMTFKYSDLSFIMCDKTLYDKTTFVLGSSSLLHMMGFKQVLLYDKDIIPEDHYSGILHEKDRIENVSYKDHEIGLFNAEIIIV